MKEDYNQPISENDKNDCGCSDGNCKPKKKNIATKLISLVIILIAVTIIVIKLTGSGHDSGKQLVNGKVSCDTSKSSACDTSKGSSCCSKK